MIFECLKEELKKRGLSPEELQQNYPLKKGTLANMRWQKKGPKYFKIPGGRKVVYRPEDIEAWLFANPVLTIDAVKDCG